MSIDLMAFRVYMGETAIKIKASDVSVRPVKEHRGRAEQRPLRPLRPGSKTAMIFMFSEWAV
jgi:hypothetical protein